jgi:hypothetical protein
MLALGNLERNVAENWHRDAQLHEISGPRRRLAGPSSLVCWKKLVFIEAIPIYKSLEADMLTQKIAPLEYQNRQAVSRIADIGM